MIATPVRHLFYWTFLGFLYYFLPMIGLSLMLVEIYPYFNGRNVPDEEGQGENRVITDADVYPDRPVTIRRLSVSPYRKRQRM